MGGTGNPGAPPPQSMQRPGGPVTWDGGSAPAAGQFGGAAAPQTQLLGATPDARATANNALLGAIGGATGNPTTGPTDRGYINGATVSPSTSNAPTIGPATGNGVGLSTINPDADLRSQSILPTNDVNRMDIANRELKNYEDQALPEFRNKLRNTFQNNAALGRNGSGMLRTDVGNLDLAEQNAYNAKKTSLLDAALGDTIGDARNNRDEYRTERGYQNGLEDQAYNRGVQGLTLDDYLTNSAFNRADRQNSAGQAGNPAQMQMILSQIFGNQASSAGQAEWIRVAGQAARADHAGGDAEQVAARED
jgi:hypothetical protein